MRATTTSKKWKKQKKQKNSDYPHFQRNERNKGWNPFLSMPGLYHDGSLGWPRPIWNSMVATTVYYILKAINRNKNIIYK